MATEDDHPSLYSALYNAMTDNKLIGDLLRHYEFRRKAGQICRDIAGPNGGEELFQEAHLRVLEHASDLNPDTIRGEREFFQWFSKLARHVHLSNVLSAAAVNRCTEEAGLWPESSDDVPPDDMGQFLAHADECPYHTRILRAEDEVLCAAFNRARGLDSQGRILLGDELNASVNEHRRRLQGWREAASRKGTPFGRLVLFNGGREVASCGEFYEFSIHKSQHELDPYSGLHICVTSSDKPDENVLLGFYALAGVRHTGEEHLLELENGYTVGLRMKQSGETIYDIHFRCVETKQLEPEPVADEDDDGPVTVEPPDGGRSGVSPVTPAQPLPLFPGPPVTPGPGGWWPPPRSFQTGTLFALLVLVSFPVLLLAGKRWGQVEKGAASLAEALRTPLNTAEVGIAPHALPPAEGHVSPTPVKATQPKPIPSAQASAQTKTGPKPPTTADSRPRGTRPQTPKVSSTRKTGRGATTRPKVPNTRVAARGTHEDRKQYRSMLAMLRGSGYAISDVKSLNKVDDRRSLIWLLSSDGRTSSARAQMLHVTKNVYLSRRLDNALRKQRVSVMHVAEHSPAMAKLGIIWDASVDSTGKKRFVVTLNGNNFRGSEKIFGRRLSYEGVGSSIEAAYDAAIGKAMKQIVAWIEGSGNAFSAVSASDNGGAKRPRPALPESDPTDGGGQN